MSRKLTGLGLLVATALVGILGFQNKALQEAQGELRQQLAEPYSGMWVPRVLAPTLGGSEVRLGQPEHGVQVLFFFEPKCPYCRDSVPAIHNLMTELHRVRETTPTMIGVSIADIESTRSYVEEHNFTFPIALLSDTRSIALFRAHVVPSIQVVDARGQIRHAHVGLLKSKEEVDSILAAVMDHSTQDN